ncbi:TonB-dependent hemoglobin/transferrin/lactoferrin family receptor [Campylobacter sp. FMV-PI01]|uniref:TonB-dependent hemoglobin/transferrin/lactoferrin family receptor n=1 Tax=Campylobacter portucalensis TaxID=2608384 RepID=A0A6L5WKI8_9BACT|nr:TonB-dependent hemoglobin/transferrin/lactoferrin family receptor [Campylobacter portucalensis]MSN96932.1 TonB-dependent hemoglobin/transferrin/lactoferrin family receptor [Campylobacter portucalensis]
MKKKLTIITPPLLLMCNVLNANEEAILLDKVEVNTYRISAKKQEMNDSKITKSMIIDERDLVKHEAGVSISDAGRSGANGYAIRGVDKNRVSVKIDGIEAAESFQPSYDIKKGFVSGVRSGTELENLSSINISKGANSIKGGSGALGGVILMQTKVAQDFVKPNKNLGFYNKTGYTTKNNEFKQVVGAGFVVSGFEGLFQYTKRKGKETKNYIIDSVEDRYVCGSNTTASDYNKFCGPGRILPNPLRYDTNSYLAKIGYRFDDHFVNLFYESKNIKNNIEEKTFPASRNNTLTQDKTPYKRYGISYELYPSGGGILEELKFQIARQEVDQIYNEKSYPLRQTPIYKILKTTQNKNQIDINLNTTDLEFKDTYHSIYFGSGFSDMKFDSEIYWPDNISKKSINLKNRNFLNLKLDENGLPTIIPAPKEKLSIKRKSQYTQYLTFDGINNAMFKYQIINDKIYLVNDYFIYTRPIDVKTFYAYIGDNIQFNDNISLNIGARYDKTIYKLHQTDKLGQSGEIAKALWDMPDKKSLDAISYNFDINYKVFDDAYIGYSFNTAFRFPTIEESFLEYRSDNNYISNFNINKESAYNHEISFNLNNDFTSLSLVGFYTKYNNFIDYELTNIVGKDPTYGYDEKKLQYQYKNIDKATIKGIEAKMLLDGKAINLDGFYTILMASYQKGKKSDGTSLMAAQPLTFGFSLGYDAPKYSIVFNGKFQKSHTGNFYFKTDGRNKEVKDIKLKEISTKSYFVGDLLLEYRINENFKLNLGIFNIFDTNYTPWETIRENKNNGSLYFISEQEDSKASGKERLSAPGRNYGLSFEMKF